jgi:hypothetical protein
MEAESYARTANLLHRPWRVQSDIAGEDGLYAGVFEFEKFLRLTFVY